MAGSLDQILQEQIVGALFSLADHHLRPVQFEPLLLADIVIQSGAGLGLRAVLCCGHMILKHSKSMMGGSNLAPPITLRQPVRKVRLCPPCARDLGDRAPMTRRPAPRRSSSAAAPDRTPESPASLSRPSAYR